LMRSLFIELMGITYPEQFISCIIPLQIHWFAKNVYKFLINIKLLA
jgi:hypothetical protein